MNQTGRIAVLVSVSFLLIAAPGALPTNPHASEPPTALMTAGVGGVIPGLECLGASGNLRALIGTPSSLEQNQALVRILSGIPMPTAGVYPLGLAAPDGESLVVVSMEPLESMTDARLADYRVGRWPTSGVAALDPRYAPPSGYIPVTSEIASTKVSTRFRLRDFLTHDQQDVWPKVLVLRVPLVDKLELIANELERRGLSGSLHVMSGFRTPQYNAQGVGSKGGRASASRHMYGDAADIFVDANGDGAMDDLDGDGKSTIRDARVLFAVAEAVELLHPELVGGLSAYSATTAHGPFVHVDVRGTRARW